MPLFRIVLFVFLATLLAGCGTVARAPGPEARAAAESLAAQADASGAVVRADAPSFRLFAQVFDQVRTFYVDSVDDKVLLTAAAGGMRRAFPEPAAAGEDKLATAAINGMLGALDPYSAYLDPRNYGAVRNQTRGQFSGIGLQITRDNGAIKVISPIDDGPAAKAGIRPGDRITHADGRALAGLTLRQAVRLLRGPAGSRVVLTVARGTAPAFQVPITRALIHVKAVRWSLEGAVGYIRISSFTTSATDEFEAAVAAIRKKAGPALAGLVIDLRNNPGGLLEQSVTISDDLLQQGDIVSTKGRTYQQRFRAHQGDVTGGLPIVVLVNRGSASAAEILAGALKDHGRALLVGERTFGKGTVQTIIPLGHNDALKLTTARYFTPDGTSVDGGIPPNIAVAQDPDRPGDEQRERAVAELGRLAQR